MYKAFVADYGYQWLSQANAGVCNPITAALRPQANELAASGAPGWNRLRLEAW